MEVHSWSKFVPTKTPHATMRPVGDVKKPTQSNRHPGKSETRKQGDVAVFKEPPASFLRHCHVSFSDLCWLQVHQLTEVSTERLWKRPRHSLAPLDRQSDGRLGDENSVSTQHGKSQNGFVSRPRATERVSEWNPSSFREARAKLDDHLQSKSFLTRLVTVNEYVYVYVYVFLVSMCVKVCVCVSVEVFVCLCVNVWSRCVVRGVMSSRVVVVIAAFVVVKSSRQAPVRASVVPCVDDSSRVCRLARVTSFCFLQRQCRSCASSE